MIDETSVNLAPLDDLEPTDNTAVIINAMADRALQVMLERGNLGTGQFVTNNKIVLRILRPNPTLMQKAVDRFKTPVVPEAWDDEYEAMKPNPADPDYIAALEKHNSDVLSLIYDLYLSHVEVVKLPSGICEVASTEWEEDITLFGIEVPARGRARTLAWLTQYAITDQDEYANLINFAFFYNNRLREDDIRTRMASFRGDAAGTAD